MLRRTFGATPPTKKGLPTVSKNHDKPSEDLDELGARLKALREEVSGEHPSRNVTGPGGALSGFGSAFRIGTELVAALIVGVGVGYFLDRWLGTAPVFLIVFFFLGAGAGILNVYRAASGIGTLSGLPPGKSGKTDEEE